jgi:NitT/TauT family transport system permease protein
MGPLSQVALVIIPAIAPSLLTGIKLALAYAFIGILAGEFILASAGIGHAIAFAYDAFDNRTMYGLIAFTLILVTLMNMGLTACERWLLRGRTR